LLTLGQACRSFDRLVGRIEPDAWVLDIGSGTGALALRAAARGAQVVALDINPSMLDVGRRKAEAAELENAIDWREMGVAEMDTLPDHFFDVVCSGLCFSELTSGERRYALEQARRLLRPDGLLLLADEIRPRGLLQQLLVAVVRLPLVVLTWLLTQTTTHAVPDLHEMVAAAGFEPIEIREALLGSWVEVVARRT
jgi:demethylmenaquinone methyltransferase/2-methoxy-6-polyprenyl-1,4-benzoquinol methylase